ncbi:MAG: NAD-dependent epimerase/dehydratase family protein [Chlamydiales bacterium]|jgi:UDP-glucuronate 4-epimerase|nr:NAD-dependent epimerase/dehydratase family protein [Chlamydiales bacterium]
MDKIFITGIAGFIGFHLAKKLHKLGFHVSGCDNFNPYYDPALKHQRASFLQELGILVLNCDLNDKEAIELHLKTWDTSHFVHLAAQAGIRHSITHPESYMHSNLSGFFQVLEIVRKNPNLKFIYASSSSVYGKTTKTPFCETTPTDKPNSFYGATKKCNEIMAESYYKLYGLHCTALRFFTVYGPWGRPDMAYFSFTKSILENQPIPVFGEGKLIRDFTYIDDIVDGIIASLQKSYGCNDIFNLGYHKPYSISELISYLETLLEKKAIIQFLPTPPGDVPITHADVSKSKSVLNFDPKVDLKEGLSYFIKWYQKQYG